MGQSLEQHAVLAARRLSLGHISEDDCASTDRESAGAGDCPHLRGCRERGAPAAEQAGLLDELDQRSRSTPLAALGKRRLTMDCQVLGKAHCTVRRHAGQ